MKVLVLLLQYLRYVIHFFYPPYQNPAPIGGGYQVSRTEPIRQNTFSSQGIGFQFLARMLRSKDSPDGCPKLMFQSVALSVLSCFANEAEIMTHPSVSTWNINFRDFSVKG